jgi:alpha-tubulin suppressor-like RCC1 family protein
VPSLITQRGDDSPTPPYEGFTISCGDDFACAGIYGAAGAAYFSAVGCWGSRTVGQIGAPAKNGYEVDPRYPSQNPDGGVAPIFGAFKVGLVATGAAHGCSRFEQNGTPVLQCWGNNTHGQTGSTQIGVRPAEAVTGFDATPVTALAAGGRNTCIIAGGQARCIGANEVGQLGTGAADGDAHATFADVDLPPSASAISIGTSHACAVLGTAAGQKGPIACWGLNDQGQLGDGLDIDSGYADAPANLKRVRAKPVKVLAPK